MTSDQDTLTPNHHPAFPAGPVVSVDWLAKHLGDDNVMVLCASMGDPEAARTSGIPGAFLADLEADFSDQNAHLPHTVPARLRDLLQNYGISDDTTVVVYDRHGLMVAPRAWWLLRVAGLDRVGVLDGGLPAWTAAGHNTTELSTPVGGGQITAEPRPELLVGIDGVEKSLARSNQAVVDARSSGRFAGVDPEPRPGISSGHIPGSENLPFDEVADAEGKLRPVVELREIFEELVGNATSLVFSCGSGVTACVDAYAAVVAGYDNVSVYDGSWTEWAAPDNQKPIA